VLNRSNRVAFCWGLVCLLVMVVGKVHYRVTQHCWLVWLRWLGCSGSEQAKKSGIGWRCLCICGNG